MTVTADLFAFTFEDYAAGTALFEQRWTFV